MPALRKRVWPTRRKGDLEKVRMAVRLRRDDQDVEMVSKRLDMLDACSNCLAAMLAARSGKDVYSEKPCHAAAIAWVLGRKLKLDPVSESFIGDSEANLFRTRPSRDWAV